jgi:hypothetical protein
MAPSGFLGFLRVDHSDSLEIRRKLPVRRKAALKRKAKGYPGTPWKSSVIIFTKSMV